jgi:hypothetical protein
MTWACVVARHTPGWGGVRYRRDVRRGRGPRRSGDPKAAGMGQRHRQGQGGLVAALAQGPA